NCEHLNKREYFDTIKCMGTDGFKCPGAPVRFSETPWKLNAVAPSLSEHNHEVFCTDLKYSKQELVQLSRTGII
ncbi:MAG: hypothetical protein DRH26_07750, partial [Deltaproteobacteria bacterium]